MELARATGFPDPNLAAAVAMAESSGSTSILGDNGTSVGLWQIHLPAHPEYSREAMQDPVQNAAAALKISGGGKNWAPWGAFTNGAYKRYL